MRGCKSLVVHGSVQLIVAAAVLVGPASAGTPSVAGGLSGYRWDPCQPIGYRVNERGGYPGSVADVRRAFAKVGRASGIRFVYEGPTRQVAFVTGEDVRTDITVSWATPRRVPKLAGTVAGMSKTLYVAHDRVRENVGGLIVLDASQRLRPGFAAKGRVTWGQVFLHEIGHVMGLSHVNRRSEVMNRKIGRYNHRLGPGDRRRLHRIGPASGCLRNSLR